MKKIGREILDSFWFTSQFPYLLVRVCIPGNTLKGYFTYSNLVVMMVKLWKWNYDGETMVDIMMVKLWWNYNVEAIWWNYDGETMAEL